MLTIENNRYFKKDDKPFFYLADTCWSAFTNINDRDWTYYLNKRKEQGFNTLQINVLPQWDASGTDLLYMPYEILENGMFDFNKINKEYFVRARKMVEEATVAGFQIALVLLWCNYLPDTWARKLRETSLLPLDYVEEYTEYVVKLFQPFNPIYMVSGDTDFPSELVNEYYEKAMNKVKEIDSTALTTLHIRGREMDIPDRLKKNKNLDFYMFQSGHNAMNRDMSYLLAEEYYKKQPTKPSLNSEPCYEQMGYSRRMYGRFSRYDVRKAAWQSVLAGGTAGVTYGAHGIWSWHQSQLTFDSTIGEAFEQPYDWHDALEFPGAWDYGYIKQVVELYKLADIVPADIILNDTKEIRAAENNEFLILYVPSNIAVKLNRNLEESHALVIDLISKKQTMSVIEYNDETKISTIPMHRFLEDVIIIIRK